MSKNPLVSVKLPPYSIAAIVLALVWFLIYLTTVSPTVSFIDSGELVTAVYEPGIAHPPGYPLYVLLGYVASHVLWGEVAWRVNVLSALFGALTVGAFCNFLYHVCSYLHYAFIPSRVSASGQPQKSSQRRNVSTGRSRRTSVAAARQAPRALEFRLDAGAATLYLVVSVVGASLLASSATFWSRTSTAKMYTLHYFFVCILLLFALQFRSAYELKELRSARRNLLMLAFLLGLSFTNHLMTSLLVPGLMMLVIGGVGWLGRVSAVLSHWRMALPALVAPLLLYLYLPIRSSQGPLMDWGSPDTWGDFWRHVGGWQYRVYLGGNIDVTLVRVWNFLLQQWLIASLPLLVIGIGALALWLRIHWVTAASTVLTAALTIAFAVAYGISEIEPYMVPFYIMLVTWVVALPVLLMLDRGVHLDLRWASVGVGSLAVLAAGTLLFQYPRQDHSRDRVAELFTTNVYDTLPPNSIVITDYWDAFYAPTYYLQNVRRVRPDLAIIDMSLLRYPWYTEQLRKMYPQLMARSDDIVQSFRVEQRKWVDGESYDGQLLNSLYFGLLESFVARNYDERPAYVLFRPCNPAAPPQFCESNFVAPNFHREPAGLSHRLYREPPASTSLPPEPEYNLHGLTSNPVPLDDFGREAARLYANAYRGLAQRYLSANQMEKAERMASKAVEVERAVQGR